MRKTWLVVAALLAASLAFASSAQAQYGFDRDDALKLWNIHAGAAFLSGSTDEDTTWIVGVEYERPLAYEFGMPDRVLTLGVDWIPIDTLTTGSESVVPILVGYKGYGNLGGYRAFFGAAVGTRWASDEIPELDIDDDFSFAWSVGAGVNFTPDFLGQLRYLAGSNPSDDGAFTVELGYRF